MAEIYDLQIADINNQTRWPEGTMLANQVTDSGRALEGIMARQYRDTNGSNTTTGTGAAYQLVLNRSGVTDNANSGVIICRAHVANTGSCTLQINSLTAKAIGKRGGAALVIGDILQNDIMILAYNPARDAFQLLGV